MDALLQQLTGLGNYVFEDYVRNRQENSSLKGDKSSNNRILKVIFI